jgi:hypothetical protein
MWKENKQRKKGRESREKMKTRIYTKAELKHMGATDDGRYMVRQTESFVEFYESAGREFYVYADKYPIKLPREIKTGGIEGEMFYWR